MSRRGLPAAVAAQRDSLHAIESSDGAACDAERVTRCPERKEGMVVLTNGAHGIGVIMRVIGLYFADTPFAEFLASRG